MLLRYPQVFHILGDPMNPRRSLTGWKSLGIAAVFLASLGSAPLVAQQPARTSAVAGTVRDSIGHALRLVEVVVENTTLTTTTDDSGRFHIRGIPAGRTDFTVRRVGWEAVAFGTTLAPDSTLVLDIRMRPLTNLEPVMVTAERLKRFESTGFGERRKAGIGSFIGPERIDSMQHLPAAGFLLRGVRGLDVGCSTVQGCKIIPRTGPPCLKIFVNGGERPGDLDENVSMSEVYAIEVYERPVLVPAEFQGKLEQKRSNHVLTPKAGCGAIAVWTRGRAQP
jgi:hypothetical protein